MQHRLFTPTQGVSASAATLRLTLSYLAIIMLMSIGFSMIFFNTSSRELERQRPIPTIFDVENYGSEPILRVTSYLNERINESRRILLIRIVLLNVAALSGGCVVSYILARRTLRPIEDNMQAQEQFISDASHELRTPLTALRTANEVALRRKQISDDEARALLQQNVDEVQKLQTLSNGLLSLAKRHEQPLKLEPVKLQPAVTEALNRIVEPAVAKNLAVEDNVASLTVMADETNLVQLLVILLDNAVKYSVKGKRIFVTAKSQNKQAVITVRDEGVGIQAADLPHIFDRFYRADQSRGKRQTSGYGIGLALARKIVDEMHGDITVKSTPKKGSTFTVTLQLAP